MAEETLFRNIFMMTFRTLTSPERLFELLVDKYQMDHPSNLGVEEIAADTKEGIDDLDNLAGEPQLVRRGTPYGPATD
jgi:hypothetical protein